MVRFQFGADDEDFHQIAASLHSYWRYIGDCSCGNHREIHAEPLKHARPKRTLRLPCPCCHQPMTLRLLIARTAKGA
jgi:hypothetical protein